MKVYFTTYWMCFSEAGINVSMSRNQNEIITKEYVGHVKKEAPRSSSNKAFGNVLMESLSIAITKLLDELDTIDKTSNNTVASAGAVNGGAAGDENGYADSIGTKNSGALLKRDVVCSDTHGRVRILSGTRGISDIQSHFDSIWRELRLLYKERCELNHQLTGSICVYFIIDREGNVGNISLIHNELHDTPIEEMLIDLLSGKKYATIQSDDTHETEVLYRFKFLESTTRTPKGVFMVFFSFLLLIPLTISVIRLIRVLD